MNFIELFSYGLMLGFSLITQFDQFESDVHYSAFTNYLNPLIDEPQIQWVQQGQQNDYQFVSQTNLNYFLGILGILSLG